MTSEQWSALFEALQRAADDVRENRAPPAPVSTSSLADVLERIAANLPAVILTLRAHQGVETGIADILAALAKAGVPHAADVEAAVLALPGALETAERYLPVVLGVVRNSQAAPVGIPGGWSGARGHIL